MISKRVVAPPRRSAVAGFAIVAALSAGCGAGSSHPIAGPTTLGAGSPSTTTTTVAPAPTTTVVPPNLQDSAAAASAVFMDDWFAGNRAGSATVATPAAVAALYATAYAGQPLNDRGCTDQFPPLVCTWGPYAGGSGSIYQVSVSPAGAKWFVSSVVIES